MKDEDARKRDELQELLEEATLEVQQVTHLKEKVEGRGERHQADEVYEYLSCWCYRLHSHSI